MCVCVCVCVCECARVCVRACKQCVLTRALVRESIALLPPFCCAPLGYSGICVGWGWGEASYVRNIVVENNSITKIMQRLADGGGVYTNTPCLDCHVSGNYFATDPAPYGCVYHDGGSGLWNDWNNVFNHITSHIAFAHGSSTHTTFTNAWYNASEAPNLQGDSNHDIRDPATGKCVNVSIININSSATWPPAAQAIVDNAGRRAVVPPPVVPPLSLPSAKWPPPHYKECNTPAPGPPGPPRGAFSAEPCKVGAASQAWVLSPGVAPGDSQPTNVALATRSKASCWEIEACATGDNAAVNCNWGCKALPASCSSPCNCNGAWSTNANGTITSVMDGHCLQIVSGRTITVGKCTGNANQKFVFTPSGVKVNNTFTVSQGSKCIDQAANSGGGGGGGGGDDGLWPYPPSSRNV